MADVLAAGVDACRSGWIAVVLEQGVFCDAVQGTTITKVLSVLSEASVIGIDIPIGIDGTYPRLADLDAREFVGRRRSSVFKTPPREVLEAPDHWEANEIAKSLIGVGISRQTFGLAAKILEVDGSRGGISASSRCILRSRSGPWPTGSFSTERSRGTG